MNRRLKFIFSIFLFISFSSVSQEKQLTSLPYKVSQSFKVFDFDDNYCLTKGNEILVIKTIRNHCAIQKFDASEPKLLNESRYINFFPNKSNSEKLMEVSGKYFLFYSVESGKSDNVFAQEIDFEKSEFINEPILILSTKGKVNTIKQDSYLHKNRTENTKFEFIQSLDKENLLIRYITKFKKGLTSLSINLFDKFLNKQYSKYISIELNEKDNILLSNLVNNKGDFFFITKYKLDKSESNFNFKLNILKNETEVLNSTDLNTEGKFVNELWLRENKNEIICGGFSSDYENTKIASFLGKTEKNNANGIIIFKTNFKGDVLNVSNINFPNEIINFYKKNKETNVVGNLYMHDLILLNGDNIVFVGEQYSNDKNSHSFSGSNAKESGIYTDIIIAKINSQGMLHFIKRLPKIQISDNEMQPFSFKTFCSIDYIYLPFIDALKNLNANSTKLIPSGGDLILSRISLKNGDIKRKYILNIGHKGEDLNKFSINRFYKPDSNFFCFDAYIKNKEDVMVKVDFE